MPGNPPGAAFFEAVPEVAVGQLHDDDELAVDNVVAFQRQDIGVANRFDAAEGFVFLGGAVVVVLVGGGDVAGPGRDAGAALGGQFAEYELDGLVEAAGGLALPDLAETAAAQALISR